ncbi:MAG: cellulase family glycosylhydrolase, partial [Bacteroidetes bacterium]|nr:cellulase family glycosylhydrolase [Bacteroidota bacterium]
MKKLFSSFVVFFLWTISPSTAQTFVDQHGLLKTKGNSIVDSSGQVFSISGNSLFWSNWAGEFCNADVIKWLHKDWKSTLVRVAMGVEPTGAYLQKPSIEKQKVFTVVDACIAEGIYVIIDWHDHTAHKHTAEAIAFFQEMATKYGKYPNVMYEIFNEPLNISWTDSIKPYALEVIDSIRAIDPDNMIIVGTPNWSQDVDVAANDPIIGFENIAYTLHFYVPMHAQSLRDKATKAIDKGLPLFVTEWGFWQSPPDMDEFYAWRNFMKTHQLSNANWSVYTKDEASSALNAGANIKGDWDSTDLTESGTIVRDMVIHWYDSIDAPKPKICDTLSIHNKIKAVDYCTKVGVMSEKCSDTDLGYNIGYVDAADNLKYLIEVDSLGIYTVKFRVASKNGGGQFQLKIDSIILCTVDVVTTNGWQTWTTISKDVELTSLGVHELTFNFIKGGLNINWFQFGAQTKDGIISYQNNLSIAPNPFTDTFLLSGLSTGENITVSDALGRIIYSENNKNNILELGQSWPSGIYLIKINNEKSIQT